MKSPLATPALVTGVVALAFALLSVAPSFVALIITPFALVLSLVAVALTHVAASKSDQSLRATFIVSYAALAVTVGWFLVRTVGAMMI